MKRVTSCLHVLAFIFNSQPTTGENSQWLISTAQEKSSNARGKIAQQFDNEDRIPLPDPFPLPANYKANVEIALKTGRITSETQSSFLSIVTSAMYAYKKYPSCDDYMCVAKMIVGKYPFMKAVPPDPPCVSIILLFIVIFCLIFSNSCIQGVVIRCLINRFKELSPSV